MSKAEQVLGLDPPNELRFRGKFMYSPQMVLENDTPSLNGRVRFLIIDLDTQRQRKFMWVQKISPKRTRFM